MCSICQPRQYFDVSDRSYCPWRQTFSRCDTIKRSGIIRKQSNRLCRFTHNCDWRETYVHEGDILHYLTYNFSLIANSNKRAYDWCHRLPYTMEMSLNTAKYLMSVLIYCQLLTEPFITGTSVAWSKFPHWVHAILTVTLSAIILQNINIYYHFSSKLFATRNSFTISILYKSVDLQFSDKYLPLCLFVITIVWHKLNTHTKWIVVFPCW